MQYNRRDGGKWPVCYGRRRNDLLRPILFFVAAKKNGSACSGYRTTRSAADSNFFCGNREWFRLQRLSRQRSSVSDSNLRRCKEEWFRLQFIHKDSHNRG